VTPPHLDIVFLGLSITSSWGNGHATTYRGLVRELARRGHRVLFLERDVPWYAQNRDLPRPPWGRTELYRSLEDLKDRFTRDVARADLVVVGSYVPEGVTVGEWVVERARGVTAFYDIDTPVTVARLRRGDCEYVSRELVPRYGLYLSFTGGPLLRRIEEDLGARRARPLYCSADPEHYRPEPHEALWDLAYLGTYSADRQPVLDRLLIEPARRWREGRFAVAGPQYPPELRWPVNVARMEHLAPPQHVSFYNAQRFSLNATRADMVKAGWSPSVRLFEAAACGTPVVSDWWEGLDAFFEPGREILVARTPAELLGVVRDTPEDERRRIGAAARDRVLREHTAAHRAATLESYLA
jgi:spore maturation protein CgeB